MWYFFMACHAFQSVITCWFTNPSWLAKVYVSVNAFRSLFPVKVLERQCLTNVSSPVIDRYLSTVSELCFAKQLSDSLYCPTWIMFYAISAEICCWFAVITQNNLFHVYEEYLWFLIGYSYYWATPLPFARMVAMAYCIYMLCMDIPMYAFRYLSQEVIPLSEGLRTIHECTRVNDFSDEYMWRTGYFVGGSQLSMYIDSIY
jgi:hypothetical protein